MSTSGDGEEEILVRISKASQAFASLRSTWRSKNIRQKTKIRFFKSNVLSTLLHFSESWNMTKTISHKLEVFQNKCLRRVKVLGTRLRQFQTMSCVEEQEQNQSHSKSGERDGNGLVMCCACHQQHYHELPSGGPLMAAGREADEKEHGGGQWRKR